MKKIEFSTDWRYRQLNSNESFKEISVPHDAMITEKRSADSMGGHNIGYFEANDYEYQKDFYIEVKDQGKRFVLEFEGVYHQAEIYLNNQKIMFRPYGYIGFFVDITKYLKFGQENYLKVIVQNHLQPNSRWYTGTGIYRPVNLYVGDTSYILENGVRVRTLSIETPLIEVEVKAVGADKATVEVLDGLEVLASSEIELNGESIKQGNVQIPVSDAKLWSAETPHLYQIKVSIAGDEVIETIGIRSLEWSTDKGLSLIHI